MRCSRWAKCFEASKNFSKAALTYESFLERFPEDPAEVDVSIRLGRACRELGAFKSALGKFYNALHGSMRPVGPEVADRQKKTRSPRTVRNRREPIFAKETTRKRGDSTAASFFWI